MKGFRRLCALLVCLATIFGILCGCQKQPINKDITAATDPAAGTQETLTLDPKNNLIPAITKAENQVQKKAYTLMVYMVGSDLESQGGCASQDLLEMLNSGLRGTDVNLLVYTGGAASWELNVRSDVNTVFALDEAGTTLVDVAYTGQPENMGDPNTIWSFLDYAVNYYPAEQYGLICWDHGSGPLYGFGNDELYGYDSLSIQELELALANSAFAQQKLGFIGFDACLMASLEVAVAVSPYANYLVASQETEPGTGWDYSFLADLNFSSDSWALSQSILRTYEASMLSNPWNPEYTLSCINLAAVDNLAASLDTVWISLLNTMDRSYFNDVARSRSNTKCFGLGAVSDRGSSLDLVDIGSLLNNLPQQTNQYALQKVALNSAVISQVTNLSEASGLSLYFPYDNKTQYQYSGYQFDSDSPLVTYTDFLNCYAYYWLGTRAAVNWEDAQSLSQTDEALEIKLEDELRENLGSVTYSILKRDPENDTYWALLTEQAVVPDEAGTVTISRDPDVFVLSTDRSPAGYGGTLWPMAMAESSPDKNRYITAGTMLMPNADAVSSSWEPVQIAFSDDLATGQVTIQSILARDNTENALYGKQDVDISHWGIIGHVWSPMLVTSDADGQVLPCSQWEDTGEIVVSFEEFDQTLQLHKVRLQSQEGEFYCQIVIRDAAGNVLGTRLEPLFTNIPYEEKTVSVPEGTMTFHVYPDHAVLSRFQAAEFDGDAFTYGNYTLTVPQTVGGVPVTEIGQWAFDATGDISTVRLPDTVHTIGYGAFSRCRQLTQINLPASLRYIYGKAFAWTNLSSVTLPEGLLWMGSACLAGTGITEVTIPSSVIHIGNGVFTGCHALQTIHVAQGSGHYTAQDGVLFTADGKQLMAYPEAKGATYAVPAGTAAIAPEAFRYNDTLTNITFPEGLQSIGIAAFSDTYGLQEIILPDSLETIGNDAFGCEVTMAFNQEPTLIPTLRLGGKLRWIGTEAFSGYLIGSFAVAEGNEHYSAKNGCLLNAAGTQLLQVPNSAAGAFTVPEGVHYVGWSALEGCSNITELTVPDSVVAIANMAGVPESLVKVQIGKGLVDWRNVDVFHFVEEISIDPDNSTYTVGADGAVYSKDMTTLYLYYGQSDSFTVPEGVTTIASGAFTTFYGDTTLRSLTLPASLERFQNMAALTNLSGLEQILVAEGSETFASYDGLLYTKDGRILLACPNGRTGTVTVREGTQEIAAGVFTYRLSADTVVIPEGVTILRQDNFTYFGYNKHLTLYLPASLSNIHREVLRDADAENLTLHCPEGSYAESFAEALGLTADNAQS